MRDFRTSFCKIFEQLLSRFCSDIFRLLYNTQSPDQISMFVNSANTMALVVYAATVNDVATHGDSELVETKETNKKVV